MENIGIVMQENFFKNDTVASNIALGKEVDLEKIKKVLILSNAWDFVKKLPTDLVEAKFSSDKPNPSAPPSDL